MDKPEEYSANKKIDYLSLTYRDMKYPDAVIGEKAETLKYAPVRGYTKAWRTDIGAIVQINENYPNMGTHVDLSGSVLDVLRLRGMLDAQIAQFAMACGKVHLSRVDIAITSERKDGEKHELNPHDIAQLCADGALVSKLKPDNHVINPGLDIETAYIGSRKARNRLFRAYDKGIDLDLDRFKLIRYELETRKNARAVVSSLALGTDIGAIMRRYVDFPENEVWVSICGADSARMPQIEDTRTPEQKAIDENNARWHWLMTSVSPALARAIQFDSDNGLGGENLRLFMVHTMNKIEGMRKNEQ